MFWPFRKTKQVTREAAATPGRIITSIGTTALSDDRDISLQPEKRQVHELIAEDLERLRGEQRAMENTNDYMRRYLTSLEDNVVGAAGFRFQSGVMRRDGSYNKPVNDRLEEHWRRQADPANYTVEGEASLLDEAATDKLILRSIARDGSVFVRILEEHDNETRFAVQVIGGDVLDHTICTNWRGRKIVNGVELDEWNRPVAYHVSVAERGTGSIDSRHTRMAAGDMLLVFRRESVAQRCGLPWGRSVGATLHGLDEFEKNVLFAAREAACKHINYEVDVDSPVAGMVTADDLSGDIQPGDTNLLPPGVRATAYDPSQPTINHPEYRNSLLMRGASGLNMSHQSLSADLSRGNFSSQRVALLDEREYWKGLQHWFCRAVKCTIYRRWLRMARIMADIPRTFTVADLNFPIFRGRRWAWVDPEKDFKAAKGGVEEGFTSRERIIAESDSDTDEEGVLRAIARGKELEEEILTSQGYSLGPRNAPPPPPAEPQQEDNEQEEEQAANVVAI